MKLAVQQALLPVGDLVSEFRNAAAFGFDRVEKDLLETPQLTGGWPWSAGLPVMRCRLFSKR